MKILLSANNYPTPEYPLQAFIGVLCEELSRQGHDVTVIAAQTLGEKLKTYKKWLPYHSIIPVETSDGTRNINVYRPKVWTITTTIFPKLFYKMVARATCRTAFSLNEDFDVVYSHFWSSVDKIYGYLKKTQKPFVVATGEDIINPKRLSNEVKEFVAKNIAGVICVSTKNKNESISMNLCTPEKCIVLPNAIDSQLFYKMNKSEIRDQLGISKNSFVVAFCGRFNNRKGVFRLEEALKRISDNSVRAIFIGLPVEGQEQRPQYDETIFCGSLPHEEVAKYLNAADVYVLPTLAEGCSNSIVEAMACGLPIISSDLPFNHDILDQSNSIMIDPMNVQSIADAIMLLKTNSSLHEKLSTGSLNKAKELTIEKRVESIVNFVGNKIKKGNLE